jgi:hypothetical protein
MIIEEGSLDKNKINKMKKTVKLTETDLNRIIKRILNEQPEQEAQGEVASSSAITVPTIPQGTKFCGEGGVKLMKSAKNYGAITHIIPDNRNNYILFTSDKKYCAATSEELKQIIG